MPRALLSVSDKTGLLPFAQALTGRGYELVSTGGTARALENAGIAVTGISAVTGFPEIMDGRVKTLHPAVHGGILARRGRADDMATIGQHDITPIDIVVVNLYPFVTDGGDTRHRVRRARRGNRHRRPQHGALGRQEFPGRRSSSSIRRTTRACSPSSSGRAAFPANSASIWRERRSRTPRRMTPPSRELLRNSTSPKGVLRGPPRRRSPRLG